jgi:hypothetical protein
MTLTLAVRVENDASLSPCTPRNTSVPRFKLLADRCIAAKTVRETGGILQPGLSSSGAPCLERSSGVIKRSLPHVLRVAQCCAVRDGLREPVTATITEKA